MMLDCHSNISMAPEAGFAVWYYDKYKDWSWDPRRLEEDFLEDLFKSRKFDTWKLPREALLAFVKTRKPGSYRDLTACVYEYYGIHRGRTFTRWGDKNNFHVHEVVKIHSIFPDALFLHIVRDGRDVACSCRELGRRNLIGPYAPSLPTEIEQIAQMWQDGITSVLKAGEELGVGMIHELRFEDLVLDTEPSLRRVCAFLGEEFDARVLDYYKANREKELEPTALLPWKEKTLMPPQADVVGRHLRDLTAEEQEAFEDVCRALLERYGYLRE